MTRPAACFLFTPALDARKVASALKSGADAVILDLEDSVPPAFKAQARASIAASAGLERSGAEVWVRVNAGGADFDADVAAIDWRRVTGAVLPKAEEPAHVEALASAGVTRALLILESAVGLHALERLARTSRVVERFAIGTYDLALDLGLLAVDNPDDSELMWQARGQMVLDSRRLGLMPPVDGVFSDLSNDEGLRTACLRAQRVGCGAKLLVHPRQIPIARSVFEPDAAALDAARRLVEGYARALEQGRGAISIDGRMVDRPMVERAKALLARAGYS